MRSFSTRSCLTFFAAVGLAGLMLVGCDSNPIGTDEDQSTATADQPAILAKKVSTTTANVYWFPEPPTPPSAGTSTLTRNENGASMTLKTTGIPAGHVVTIWGVIFNKPGECTDPCNLDDLGREAVMPSVLRVTGNVVGGGDNANFGGRINEGDDSEALFGPGLMDAMTAEVHFIVRDHGPKRPDMVDAQIHEVSGGCDGDDLTPVGGDSEIPDEPGECNDLQFSVHLPPA